MLALGFCVSWHGRSCTEATPDGPEVLAEVPAMPDVPAMPAAEAGDVFICLSIYIFIQLQLVVFIVCIFSLLG